MPFHEKVKLIINMTFGLEIRFEILFLLDQQYIFSNMNLSKVKGYPMGVKFEIKNCALLNKGYF